MRQTYFKTSQTRFPKSTIPKCGFRQRWWTHVEFKTPRRKKGDFNIARGEAFHDAEHGGRIIAKTEYYIVWKSSFGVYYAIWLEGHDPTDKYGDYWF